jgi:hypothetical protein
MRGVNYRYTVIVRVGIRVGRWVRSVAVGAVTPALMVAVGLYQEASFSFGRCVVDVGCFSSEGQALSMQFQKIL